MHAGAVSISDMWVILLGVMDEGHFTLVLDEWLLVDKFDMVGFCLLIGVGVCGFFGFSLLFFLRVYSS